MENILLKRRAPDMAASERSCQGFAALGLLAGLLVFVVAMLAAVEAQRAHTLRQAVEDELSRAADIAIATSINDRSMMDRLLEMDAVAARNSFDSYLTNVMGLDASTLTARDAGGGFLYRLSLTSVEVMGSPPAIRVRANVALRPAYIGLFGDMEISLPVRCDSVSASML